MKTWPKFAAFCLLSCAVMCAQDNPKPLPLPATRILADNGLVRTPPMGWNSWNKFAGKITDADVRHMADAMVASGMAKLGYVYINIDDTWEGGRDSKGNLISNQKFPDMKALADYVHSKGLKIGIYSSPGPKTCAGFEGSSGYEKQDAETFASWGIDYLKYDLCSAGSIYPSSAETLQRLYQKMGEALQRTGRPIVFSLCEYGRGDVWKWGADSGGNLWRTTGDIRDDWSSVNQIGFAQLDIVRYQRPGHWNDPDMLEVGNGGMSADEYRFHMSLWALLSAPLIAGNDLTNMSDDTRSILLNRDIIDVDQNSAAKPVRRLETLNTIDVLYRELGDGSKIVGLFNRGDMDSQVDLPWSLIPERVTPETYSARDLWMHTSIPISSGSFRAAIPKHGVVILRLTPAG